MFSYSSAEDTCTSSSIEHMYFAVRHNGLIELKTTFIGSSPMELQSQSWQAHNKSFQGLVYPYALVGATKPICGCCVCTKDNILVHLFPKHQGKLHLQRGKMAVKVQ